ncbi:MAG: hypothetical protein GY754_33300 [bacterium]|nr:hypothetical protein [bacterium]
MDFKNISLILVLFLTILSSGAGLSAAPYDDTFVINNDLETTSSQSVILNIHIPGAVEMRFSNNGTFWSGWEAPVSAKKWELFSDSGYQFVFIEVRDSENKILELYDSITVQ